MKVLGIDIGTTSVCAVILHGATGEVLETISINNDAAIAGGKSWEALQDAEKIWQRAEQLIDKLVGRHPDIGAIGLTGQMHGIVYIDANGQSVSPLFTWQDGRGDKLVPSVKLKEIISVQTELLQDDLNKQSGQLTYAALLSLLSGYKLATGFGAVTHFYNIHNNLVPENAVKICTIHDYIGMRLTKRKSPLMHISDAASLGLFQHGIFDGEALRKCQIDPDIFPEVASDFAVIGRKDDIPVIVAIGDNQASFIGSVRDMSSSIVINIGTSGQISMLADDLVDDFSAMELRPLLALHDAGQELVISVGAALCGGKAYALLENLFRSVIDMSGTTHQQGFDQGTSLFPVMNKLAEEALEKYTDDSDKLVVSTRFSGTRQDPHIRGSISGIGMHNFDAQHMIIGVLEGMVDELYEFYSPDTSHKHLVGSGNALRRNPVLQKIAAKRFGLPLLIPMHTEEAAYGAALAALTGAGFCDSLEQAQSLIRYQGG